MVFRSMQSGVVFSLCPRSAARANAAEMDVIISDLKVVAANIGECNTVQSVLFEIDNLIAAHTYQVVMLMSLGLKPGNRARVTDLGNQSQLNKGIEDPVNRSTRDIGDPFLDLFKDLICRRVIIPSHDCFEDNSTLNRERKPS